jgi:chromosome segregation ATPase
MSTESREAGSGTSSDGSQACTQDIEDFLTKFSSLRTHQGFPLIGNALSQLTDLRHNHDRLREETQRLQNAHQQQIKDLEEKDTTLRQKSLKDYTDSVAGINKEKDRLSRENENLQMEIEQRTKATQAAEQLHKTELETADVMKKKMQELEESANSANRKFREMQEKLSEAQQSSKKFDAILQRRDQAESRLKEDAATARKEAEDLNKRNERLQKKLDKLKGYVVSASDVALIDL